MEARCQSGISEFTNFDRKRDQVIRLIDVGSWYARQHGFDCICLLVLQYGDAQINAQKIVNRYAGQPEAIQKALPYRDDLTEADFSRLAGAPGFRSLARPTVLNAQDRNRGQRWIFASDS